MNDSLLDILACPYDKHHPLKLYRGICAGPETETGVLYCTRCGRPYVIAEGIPIMLPDNLRDKKLEAAAIESVPNLPDDIIRYLRP